MGKGSNTIQTHWLLNKIVIRNNVTISK